jgi:hypothetical protein
LLRRCVHFGGLGIEDMRCKNDPSATFSGDEPSPKGLGYCAHAERLGAARKGRDGGAWIVAADKNGRLAWRRKRTGAAATTTDARREACIRDFAFYAKPTRGGHAVLFGTRVDRGDGETWLQTDDDHDGEPRIVPRGYVRRPMSRALVASVYCKPSVDEAALWLSGALEWQKWVNASRRHWLTIADFDAAAKKKNARLVVLAMFGDDSADERINPRGKAILPTRFFREAKCTFVPRGGGDGGIGGSLTMDKGDVIIEIGPDVERRPGEWQPLGAAGPFRVLPRKTHVGYRGPMMLWSDVAKMPRVYFV